MHVGLFFGSFNPIHVGHLIIARAALNHTELDAVWFVVSPQSPFKSPDELADQHHRFRMVQMAIAGDACLAATDVEFDLPKPSYSIDTLTHLSSIHPDHRFSLILGSDNLTNLDQWKDYELILSDFFTYAYRRPDAEHFDLEGHPHVKVLEDVPILDISSTYLRTCLLKDKSIRFLTTREVINYIQHNGLYRFDVE